MQGINISEYKLTYLDKIFIYIYNMQVSMNLFFRDMKNYPVIYSKNDTEFSLVGFFKGIFVRSIS